MRSMTWGALVVLSLIWSTVATGKELSPREIYEQASPAVVMVMGYADGGRKGSGGTGSIIQSVRWTGSHQCPRCDRRAEDSASRERLRRELGAGPMTSW